MGGSRKTSVRGGGVRRNGRRVGTVESLGELQVVIEPGQDRRGTGDVGKASTLGQAIERGRGGCRRADDGLERESGLGARSEGSMGGPWGSGSMIGRVGGRELQTKGGIGGVGPGL